MSSFQTGGTGKWSDPTIRMFGWTVVAIFIYSYLFLADLRNDLTTLPVAPQSIVLLTGLSQAGYLTSKGISKIKP